MMLKAVHDFFFNDDLESRSLVSDGRAVVTVLLMYVLFCKWLGPLVMGSRQPFRLKKTMRIYSFGVAAANLYLGIEMWKVGYSLWEDRCRFGEAQGAKKFFSERRLYIWHVWLVKYVELFDTVIFVLRKKFSQISFLHVFHHCVVVGLFWWVNRSREFGFYLLLIVGINCWVHVVMYTYYGLAAFGPRMRKYLWWKKYLTLVQITQFVVVQIWIAVGWVSGCEQVASPEIFVFTSLFLFTVLFLNFYRHTFRKEHAKIT